MFRDLLLWKTAFFSMESLDVHEMSLVPRKSVLGLKDNWERFHHLTLVQPAPLVHLDQASPPLEHSTKPTIYPVQSTKQTHVRARSISIRHEPNFQASSNVPPGSDLIGRESWTTFGNQLT
ncbi:hypothetical protein V6N11_021304 [Hibiscus sabdariffa]|uniref:Uncharacterized protein n=1 Tax=Hibiscus sabdariffa TaxID=183260 RepID=A0ABR2NM17_9ROSI